jgi:hypothetical protein
MSNFDNRSRRIARERYWEKHSKADYECPDCGRGKEQVVGGFQVHHKSDNPHDNRMDKLVALCGFCHQLREEKKPSLKRIKQFRNQEHKEVESDPMARQPGAQRVPPVIYTAGKMKWHNGEDSSYRASIKEGHGSDINAKFIHPYETYFDHGGDIVDGCVAEDMEMIDNADGLVALFNSTDQTGTMVETIHAANQSMKTLILLSPEVYNTTKEPKKLPHDVEPPISVRARTPLWFLINYLNGDGLVNDGPQGPHRAPLDTPMPLRFAWEGFDCKVMRVQMNDGSITRAVRKWVTDSFYTRNNPSSDESGGNENRGETDE